jgi:hypothetical protein
MEQSPFCEADSRSYGQGILHLLYNPEAHYRVHRNLNKG